jgi:hypothetical protein
MVAGVQEEEVLPLSAASFRVERWEAIVLGQADQLPVGGNESLKQCSRVGAC